jgi:ribosomal subunit interface protein
MQTQVSIHHHDYPPSMRKLVQAKLEDLIRFCGNTVSIKARLERQADQHRVEIVATVPHGPVLVADARAEGVRGALDEALDRMARKLKRAREKGTIERRRAARGVG